MVGRNVRQCRMRAKFSQESLAAALSVDQKTIGLLERGKVWPQFNNLEAIAARLGVTVEDFFQGMEHKPIKPTPEEALGVLAEALGIRPKIKRLAAGKAESGPTKTASPIFGDIVAALPTLEENELRSLRGHLKLIFEARKSAVQKLPSKKE